jgi:hypothetical protein
MLRNSPSVARVLLLALVFGLGGCSKGDSKPDDEKKGGVVENNPQSFKMSAEALAKEAFADPPAASTKYKGKVVELDGRVDPANRFLSETSFLMPGVIQGPQDAAGMDIVCAPVAAKMDRMWWLGRGQKVRVTGRVSVINPLAVYVEECTVIELEPSPTMKVTARELAEGFSADAGAAQGFIPHHEALDTVSRTPCRRGPRAGRRTRSDGLTPATRRCSPVVQFHREHPLCFLVASVVYWRWLSSQQGCRGTDRFADRDSILRFRRTRDESARRAIAAEYTREVQRLIETGNWAEAPAFEGQLPDEWMHETFFAYWCPDLPP